MGTYVNGVRRDTKEMANRQVAGLIMSRLAASPLTAGKSKFRCVLLLPSYDCLDLKTFAQFIDGNTKFICVENFRDSDIPASEYAFRENFRAKYREYVGGELDDGRVRFCFQDIEKVQLYPVLRELGEEKVDFMFLDVCRYFNREQLQWVHDNRMLFADETEGGFQLYTVPIQPRGNTYERYGRLLSMMPKTYDYDGKVRPVMIGGARVNNAGGRMLDWIRYWNFIVNHVLNENAGDDLRCLPPVIYNGGVDGTTKMGLFTSMKLNKLYYGYRWKYNVPCHLINGYESDSENGREYQEELMIGRRFSGTREIRNEWYDGDRSLFLDMPITRTDEINPVKLFDYFFRTDSPRRFDKDRIEIKMIDMCPWNFPPETWMKIHKSSALSYMRGQMIFDRVFNGRKFEYDGSSYELERKGRKYSVYKLKQDGTRDYRCTAANSAPVCESSSYPLFDEGEGGSI